jgi:quercetin dioxygenase-like cupin family protein
MKKRPNSPFTLLYSVAVACSLAACSSTPSPSPATASNAIFLAQSDIVYNDIIPNTVAFGTAYGALAGPGHGTFVKIKKGQGTPLHTHSTAYRAVVLAGSFENPVPGVESTNTTLQRGDYYTVPAGEDHISWCSAQSATDCMTFFWQDSGFDFTPQTDGIPNAGGPTVTFVKQPDVVYQDIIPGAVTFGTVFGEREFTGHGTFVRVKKGAATPSHVHSNPYRAVVIEGTFENPTVNNIASTAALEPGSFYFIPGGEEHISRCSVNSATDCLTFFWQATRFDFAPTSN